jgi:hypothetical protein
MTILTALKLSSREGNCRQTTVRICALKKSKAQTAQGLLPPSPLP